MDALQEANELVDAMFRQGQAADLQADLDAMTLEKRAEALGEMVNELLGARLAKMSAGDQVALLTRVLWTIMHK